MRQMDEPKQCFQQMYDRNPIQIQAQFMKQFEASQQRIQVLENLLDIPVAEKKTNIPCHSSIDSFVSFKSSFQHK